MTRPRHQERQEGRGSRLLLATGVPSWSSQRSIERLRLSVKGSNTVAGSPAVAGTRVFTLRGRAAGAGSWLPIIKGR